MIRTIWTNTLFCLALAAGLIGHTPFAVAADDTARFYGNWKASIPVNGVNVDILSVHDANGYKNYAIAPTGNVPVGDGKFSAIDGKWTVTSTQGNDSGTYKFTDDNTAVCVNAAGVTVTWVKNNAPVVKNDVPVAKPQNGDVTPEEHAAIQAKILAGDFNGAWHVLFDLPRRPHDPTVLGLDAQIRLGLQQFDVARNEAAVVLQLPSHLDDLDALRAYAQATAAMGFLRVSKETLQIYTALDPKNAPTLEKSVNDFAAQQPLGCAPDQIPAQLQELQKMAGAKADAEALVGQATIVLKGENNIRKVEYDFYRQRKRELTLAAAADPKNAQKLAELAQFMLDESAQIYGDAGNGYRPFHSFRVANPPAEQQQVIALCDQAIQLDSKNAQAYSAKAGALIELGQDDEARQMIKQAMAINSNDPEVLRMFGQMMIVAAAANTAQADSHSMPTMSEDADFVYIHTRSDADIAQARFYNHLADQQTQAALNALKTAIEKTRGTAAGFYYQAVLSHRDSDQPTAITNMEQAVALDPGNSYYHMFLGKLYTQIHRPDEVNSYGQKSAGDNLNQTSASKLVNLAWHQLRRKDYDGAQLTLDQAIKIDPTDPHVMAYMALLIAGQSDGKANIDKSADLLLAAWAMEQSQLRMVGIRVNNSTLKPAPADVGLELGLAVSAAQRFVKLNRAQQAYGMLKMALEDGAKVDPAQNNVLIQTASLPVLEVQDPMVPGPKGLENVKVAPIYALTYWMRNCHQLAATALIAMGKPDEAAKENAQAAAIKDADIFIGNPIHGWTIQRQ